MDPASPTFSFLFYLDIIAMNQTDTNAGCSFFFSLTDANGLMTLIIIGVRETFERNCDGDMLFYDCHHCLL